MSFAGFQFPREVESGKRGAAWRDPAAECSAANRLQGLHWNRIQLPGWRQAAVGAGRKAAATRVYCGLRK